MSGKSFNKKHPEIQNGEVFLTNVGDNHDFSSVYMEHGDGFSNIGWKTKRRGSIAYDIYGKPVSGMKPVFVQRDELKKGGIDPDNLFSDHEEKKIPFARIILGVCVALIVLAVIAFAIFAR